MRVPWAQGVNSYRGPSSIDAFLWIAAASLTPPARIPTIYRDQIYRFVAGDELPDRRRQVLAAPPKPAYPILGADGSVPSEEYVNNYVHRLLVMRDGLTAFENLPRMMRQAGRQLCEVDLIGQVLKELNESGNELAPDYDLELWKEVHASAIRILSEKIGPKLSAEVSEIIRGCNNNSVEYRRIIKAFLPSFKGFEYIARFLKSSNRNSPDVELPPLAKGIRPILPDLSECLSNLEGHDKVSAEELEEIEAFRSSRSVLLKFDLWAHQNLPVENKDHRYYAAVNALYGNRPELLADIAEPNKELVVFVREAIGASRIEISSRFLLKSISEGLTEFDARVRALDGDSEVPKELLLYWKEWFLKKLGARYSSRRVPKDGFINIPNAFYRPLEDQVEKDYYVNRVARIAREYALFRSEEKRFTKHSSATTKDYIGGVPDPGGFAAWLLRHPEEIRVKEGSIWVPTSKAAHWTTADVPMVELERRRQEEEELERRGSASRSALESWQDEVGRRKMTYGARTMVEADGFCNVNLCPGALGFRCPHLRPKVLVPINQADEGRLLEGCQTPPPPHPRHTIIM